MFRDKISKLIDLYQESDDDESRDYIGASSIGSDCLRQIWYQFKGVKAEKVPTKFRRTWAIGKELENLIIDWLIDAGIRVERLNFTLTSKIVPSFKGHIDALIFFGKRGSILEVKTAKDASFKIFVKKGIKVWNPQYYAQIQSYMGMLEINSAYILALNKDNSDLSDELVTFDQEYYEKLEEKALMIANAVVEPTRINGSPLFFKCKMCKFNKVCHT
jgi:hypothetical protein